MNYPIEGWNTFRIDELASVIMGQSPGGETINEAGDGLSFVQGKADLGMVFAQPKQYTSDPKRISEPGEILLTVRAPVGYVCKNNIRLAIGRGISSLAEFDNSNFLYYALQQWQKKFLVLEQGTTFTEINQREIKRLRISAPESIVERKKISGLLEAVDNLIYKTYETIDQAQQLKKALMQHLLSGRLKPDGTWRTPDEFYVDEKFGRVPKGWTTPRVKEFIDFLRRGRSPEYTESSIYVPVINQKCIEWDRINFDYVKHHDLQVKVPDEFFLLDQDILVNSTGTGTIGRIAMFHNYDYPCFADGHVTIIRTSRKVVQPRFLKYYLMSYNGQRHLESFCYSGSTNQIELSRSYFLNMRVPMPENPDEQTAICNKIELSQKYIECSERKINRLQRLKKSLMQNLLTGKIRVQAE